MSETFFLNSCFSEEHLPLKGTLEEELLQISQDRTGDLRETIGSLLKDYPKTTRECVIQEILEIREMTTINIPDDIVNSSKNIIIMSDIPTPDKN